MLHTARLNYGQPSPAQPCGGWEAPGSEVRGHNTGHLMSALALTFASTGNAAARARGRYLVSQLAALQALARPTGFHRGYCRRSRKVSSTGWRAASGYGRRTT